MQAGKLQTTQWIVKFDILKTEQIASNSKGFDGRPVGNLIGILGHGRGAAAGGVAVGSIKTGDTTGVWLVGMRYKIMNANTTAQVAQGYKELRMEVGATNTKVLGFSSSAKGGVGKSTVAVNLAVGVLVGVLAGLAGPAVPWWGWPLALLLGGLAAVGVLVRALQRLGGITGDVLGALVEAATLGLLLALSMT